MVDSTKDVAWGTLLGTKDLQKLLQAMVQRLDKHDSAIAGIVAPAISGAYDQDVSQFVLVDKVEFRKMKERIEVVENTTLQSRIENLGKPHTLDTLVQEGRSQFKLGEHVIPLTQLKTRVESAEVGLQVNAHAVDELGLRLAETTQVMKETLERELAKMVSKEEFKVLETKHNKLQDQVDKMMKDLVERLERMIKEVQDQLDQVVTRVDRCEIKVETLADHIDELKEGVKSVKARLNPIEEILPTKANRTELEAAIQEIRDEMAALNIEEIMAMAEKANARIDAMDERTDGIEDGLRDLKEYVHRKQQEMEDLQLEKQLEALRRELEEAKTGVFMKATQRMDMMQKDTDAIRTGLSDAQGQVQVNRENIVELESLLREAGAQISSNMGKGKKNAEAEEEAKRAEANRTKALIEGLQQDVHNLQERYAEAARKEAEGMEHAEKTESLVKEIQNKMVEIDNAKADRSIVEQALKVKADKDAVARDSEANQRAVDMALSTMNAGTQGIQQMLESQEGKVQELSTHIAGKLDRHELSRLEQQLQDAARSTGSGSGSGGGGNPGDEAEALYGGYGVAPEQAAVMARPLQKYNCLTCKSPLKPNYEGAMPALPLLPSAKSTAMTTTVAYIPTPPQPRAQSARPHGATDGDSIVEISDLQTMRTAGGSHTSPRKTLRYGEDGAIIGGKPRAQSARGARSTVVEVMSHRPTELMGEDGRIYQGRSSRGRPHTSVGSRTRTTHGSG